jgi:hypothetical protein
MEERFEEKNVFFSLSLFFSLISFQKYRRTSNTLLNIIIISTKTEYKGQKSKYRVKACTSLKRKITYNFSPLKFPIFSFIYNIHNTEFQFKQHLRRILLFFFIDNQMFFYSSSPYFNINPNTSYEENKEKKNEEKYAWFSSPFFYHYYYKSLKRIKV